MDFPTFGRVVTDLVHDTGTTILSAYREPTLQVDIKADDSPVTWADRRAEEMMRDAIGTAFPTHGIIGEEFGEDHADAEWVWVLDPIDGTRSFAAGCPLFGSLVGVLHQGVPQFGAIHLPVLGELYLGDGTVTTRNDRPVRAQPAERLADATLLYTDPIHPSVHQPQSDFATLLRTVRQARTWGDCFGYTLVASGGADLMLDPIMHRWDLMALIPIIRGAGGVITDWHGADPVIGTSSIAAASVTLHREALAVLSRG